jgi:hypothetical protein
MMMRAVLAVLAAAVIPLQAGPVTWWLQDVSFEDGGTASGYFVFDTNALTDWNISVSGGDLGVFPAFSFVPANTILSGSGTYPGNTGFWIQSNVVPLDDPPGYSRNRLVAFHFASALTDPVAFNALTGTIMDPSRECWNCTPLRAVVEGGATAVPEPYSALLLAPALLWLLRRRTCV